jgi:predicted phage-related endonuclease
VFFRGPAKFAIYLVHKNDRLIESMFGQAIDFWNKYVVPQTPPPVDGTQASADTLKAMYPEDSGEVKQVDDPTMTDLIDMLRMKTLSKKELERHILLYKNKIQEFMGDASILEFEGGKITWKKAKDTEKTDWKAVAMEVAKAGKVMLGPYEEIVAKHTKTQPGSRRFVVPRSWSKVEE